MAFVFVQKGNYLLVLLFHCDGFRLGILGLALLLGAHVAIFVLAAGGARISIRVNFLCGCVVRRQGRRRRIMFDNHQRETKDHDETMFCWFVWWIGLTIGVRVGA